MQALVPWTSLSTIRRDMERLLDRFGEIDTSELPYAGEWIPAADLAETDRSFIVKVEVAGLDPKEIQVALHDQTLTISGEKKAERVEEGERYYRKERTHGMFTRRIRLPGPVEPGTAKATLKHGVLTVTLARAGAARRATIPIRAAA